MICSPQWSSWPSWPTRFAIPTQNKPNCIRRERKGLMHADRIPWRAQLEVWLFLNSWSWSWLGCKHGNLVAPVTLYQEKQRSVCFLVNGNILKNNFFTWKIWCVSGHCIKFVTICSKTDIDWMPDSKFKLGWGGSGKKPKTVWKTPKKQSKPVF